MIASKFYRRRSQQRCWVFPIAHIHGGEVTAGAFDDAIRHAITKMACVHFVAAEHYRRRVIQMGENPEFVFNVGAPGLDAAEPRQLWTRQRFFVRSAFAAPGASCWLPFIRPRRGPKPMQRTSQLF